MSFNRKNLSVVFLHHTKYKSFQMKNSSTSREIPRNTANIRKTIAEKRAENLLIYSGDQNYLLELNGKEFSRSLCIICLRKTFQFCFILYFVFETFRRKFISKLCFWLKYIYFMFLETRNKMLCLCTYVYTTFYV